MLVIKSGRGIISTTGQVLFRSFLELPRYNYRGIFRHSAGQLFGKLRPQDEQRGQSYGREAIDELTAQALRQYQQKIKQIRDYHNVISQSISVKYKELVQSHQRAQKQMKGSAKKMSIQKQQLYAQQQEAFEQIKQQLQVSRMNQLLDNQAIQKNKIQKLASDYTTKFAKARKDYQLKYVKNYMLENVEELTEEGQRDGEIKERRNLSDKENQPSYIPNSLVLKKLYFKMDDGKERHVLLAGVEQNDEDHCAYVKTLIEKMKVKNVMTMVSPDMPFFIKTETSFLNEWTAFLKRPSPSIKFYLNPNPKTLNDITLQKTHIPYVMHGMTRSKSFYQTTYSLMQLNEVNFKYEHQPLYAGLVSSTVENVFFCDYPYLKEREMIALNVNLDDLRQLIKRFAYYKQNDKQNFSAELLLPKKVVQKKFRHVIKLAKTIALTKQTTPILICDASIAQIFAQQWKQSPLQFLQFDYSQNSYLLDMQLSKRPQQQALFIEFIQKLVILDIILKPLVQNYFVKYESFPYSCRNTIGGKENLSKVFLLWKHYFTLYSNAVAGKVDYRKEHGENPL